MRLALSVGAGALALALVWTGAAAASPALLAVAVAALLAPTFVARPKPPPPPRTKLDELVDRYLASDPLDPTATIAFALDVHDLEDPFAAPDPPPSAKRPPVCACVSCAAKRRDLTRRYTGPETTTKVRFDDLGGARIVTRRGDMAIASDASTLAELVQAGLISEAEALHLAHHEHDQALKFREAQGGLAAAMAVPSMILPGEAVLTSRPAAFTTESLRR